MQDKIIIVLSLKEKVSKEEINRIIKYLLLSGTTRQEISAILDEIYPSKV